MTKTSKKLAALTMAMMLGTASFANLHFTGIEDNQLQIVVTGLPFEIKHQAPVVTQILPIPKVQEVLNFADERVPIERPSVQDRLNDELKHNFNDRLSTEFILKMANRWLPVIEPILAEHGVPNDFKYLCIAESALQNKVSPVGAAGFWQFMPYTAPEFGLEINKEVDERYNVQKSTEAAAKYLKSAYKRFGSWTAAAASYNMGQGGLSKQQRLQGTNDYFSLLLPSETMQYVYRILSFKLLIGSPETFNIDVAGLDVFNPLPTRTVAVTKSISNLAEFAKQNGTNFDTLKELNPWLRDRKLTVKEGKSYTFALPWQDVSNEQVASL